MSEAAPRKLPFWLIVSVLVNMLLLGLIGGMLLKPDKKPAPDRPRIGGVERPLLGLESAEDRAKVRRIVREAIQDARPEMETRAAARRALGERLNAEVYDAEAISAAMSDLRAAEAALLAKMHGNLETELGDLTPAQRRAVAAAMSRPMGARRGLRRGERGRRGFRRDGGPPPPAEN